VASCQGAVLRKGLLVFWSWQAYNESIISFLFVSSQGYAMLFSLRPPLPVLQPYIEMFVYHSGLVTDYRKERLLPDGAVNLIFDLSGFPKHTYDNQTLKPVRGYKRAWLSGMHKQPLVIETGTGATLVVARFRPGGAWPFFKFPLSEMADLVVDVETLWGDRFDALHDALMAVHHQPDACFAILERFFFEVGQTSQLALPDFLDHAVQRISNAPHLLTMKELSHHMGYSQKHIIAQFTKCLGMKPKMFARVLRFQRMIHAVQHKQPTNWADFATQFGFYDQAHFINEFKAFSGFTPRRYLKHCGSYLNYLPVYE
jgi:AraC-like DNA-binding protein